MAISIGQSVTETAAGSAAASSPSGSAAAAAMIDCALLQTTVSSAGAVGSRRPEDLTANDR
jgi:hypothetical protein